MELKESVEQRRLPRKRMNKFLRLNDRENNQVLGRVMDMTTEGIMLISAEPVSQQSEVSVSLSLPIDFDGGAVVTFDVKAVWTKKSSHSSNYATGLRITNISHEDKKIISKLIARMPNKMSA